MTELRPGLHRIEAPLGRRFVALYLLVGETAAVLVDTGVRDSITDHLLPYLRSAGIDPALLRWAVNTHCDFDHTGGNGALKAALPAVRLVAHRLDRDYTENIEHLIDGRYGEFRSTDGFDDPEPTTAHLRSVTQLVPLDDVVSGGERFDLGGRSVTLLHVPGHSPGHLAVHDEQNGALLIGDAALGASVLFADGSAAFPPTYRDTDPYLRTIERLSSLRPELLLTAHYPVFEASAAERFLRESSDYVAQVDAAITAALDAARAPLTTLEIVRSAGSALGPWGDDALDYAVFPVTGNLERMRDHGRVVESHRGRLRVWASA